MPGSTALIDQRALTVTASIYLQSGVGGHKAATFLWRTTTITGTWDVALYTQVDGVDIKIAELLGVTSSGIRRVPLTADFASTRMAIPAPTKVIFTEAVAGSVLTSGLYAIYGD